MKTRRGGMVIACLGAACVLARAPFAHAGALTDGSVGAVQSLTGKFTVPQALGTVAGTNLYHSFRSFSIGVAESATFTTTGAALTAVISRVTGGQVSNIEGKLRLAPAAGSAPDFYFINPAGVTFGNNAVVDVPAAFHVSTAPRLNFADGSQWDTSAASVSSLSAAAPESFGFLPTIAAGKVTLNNRNLTTNTIVSPCNSIGTCHNMQMKNGAYTDIVAGDVEFEDSNLFTSGAGSFRVVAAGASAVTVPINGAPSGAPSGTFNMLRSALAAQNTPSTIDVHAGTVTLGNEGEIFTINQNSAADGGSIGVRATSALSLARGAEIGAVTFSTGTAANLNIQSGSLTIAGNDYDSVTGIISDTQGTGAGGNITLKVGGPVSLERGGVISASAKSAGNAGTVALDATDLAIDRSGSPVTLVAGRDKYTTGIFSDSNSTGAAGNLAIAASGAVSLRGGGAISSRTSNAGAAGTISVAANSLAIDGVPGSALFTGITTQAELGSSGNAGTVTINVAGPLTLRQAGAITSDTYGSGAAGNIAITAGQLSADGAGTRFFTGISSEATNASGGQTGNVTVTATDSLALSNTAQLSIRSGALAAAPDALRRSRLAATAPVITLADNATITAEATQNTHASQIAVNAADRFQLVRAAITTSARDGNGGPISVTAERIANLLDSRITTSVTGANGNGGNIDIAAPYLILQTGFIQANTTAALASGGLINVGVDNLLTSASNLLVGGSVIRSFEPGRFADNVIQAAAPTGVNGVITLAAPQLDLSATLATLNTTVVDLGSLLAAACQIPADSSLVVMSRGGLPPSSFGPLRPEAESTGKATAATIR